MDSGDGTTLKLAPVALSPAAVPSEAYAAARAVQPSVAEVIAAVAADHAFLQETLRPAAEFDPFTGRLLDILGRTLDRPHPRGIECAVLRSDYLLDQPSGKHLQVEFNTVAASFAGLGTKVSDLHRFLREKVPDESPLDGRLVDNAASEGTAAVIAEAHKANNEPGAKVLFVVQPGERNVHDQHAIAAALWETHGIKSVRRTLAELADGASLLRETPGDPLVVDSEGVCSVVYFRAGYTPDDYPTEKEWDARLLLELSGAVKCPSVAMHLAGTKKVQQELARPGVLERFLPDGVPGVAAAIRDTFAGLWALDDQDADDVVKMALADPSAFVLKPQREGGGNNLYGDELAARLQEGGRDLGAYILMQRIRPPTHQCLMLRDGAVRPTESISELGIFGAYLRVGEEVRLNCATGHLLRTKAASSDEGGVAAGFAVIDSPRLV